MKPTEPKKPPRKIASPAACKFCGSPYNIGERVGDWHEVETIFYVTCATCGASGPKADTQAAALEGWEARAAPIPLDKADPPPGWSRAKAEATKPAADPAAFE